VERYREKLGDVIEKNRKQKKKSRWEEEVIGATRKQEQREPQRLGGMGEKEAVKKGEASSWPKGANETETRVGGGPRGQKKLTGKAGT